MHRSNRAFTKTALIVVIVVVPIGLVVLSCAGGILLPSIGKARQTSRQLTDSTHVRGVLQAMVLYSQSNGGNYPLPSLKDTGNTTVSQTGTAKNTSENIYSLLLWNGLMTTEMLVSPAETGNVAEYSVYEYSQPVAAVSPNQALWDPAFAADFTGGTPGNVSYAHMLPGGLHAAAWANKYKSNYAMISNRGPKVSAVNYDATGAIASVNADTMSITNTMHGRTSWSGNVGFNDTRVQFITTLAPTQLNTQGGVTGDVLFFDEPNSTGVNNFLSLFTTAGDANKDFTSIWD